MIKHICTPFVFVSLLLTVACKKNELTYYEVPKEPKVAQSMELPDGHPQVDSAQSSTVVSGSQNNSELVWSRPAGWVDGVTSSMRLGSYLVEGHPKSVVDVSVTRFPGDVGGTFSNVNRWRGQLGLGRLLAPSDLDSVLSTIETDHFTFKEVSLENDASPARSMRVAILELNDFSWFIKITGEKSIVDSQSEAFEEFVRSIRLREDS